jgi:hypothetical protein
LDDVTGNWILTGKIAGDDVVHSIDARWVLGHQYLQFDESTEKGEIDYEATVFIGWDETSGQYVCKWLDSTGGSGLSNGVLGYAERSEDEKEIAKALLLLIAELSRQRMYGVNGCWRQELTFRMQ